MGVAQTDVADGGSGAGLWKNMEQSTTTKEMQV
jgi:hypothetical protein